MFNEKLKFLVFMYMGLVLVVKGRRQGKLAYRHASSFYVANMNNEQSIVFTVVLLLLLSQEILWLRWTERSICW